VTPRQRVKTERPLVRTTQTQFQPFLALLANPVGMEDYPTQKPVGLPGVVIPPQGNPHKMGTSTLLTTGKSINKIRYLAKIGRRRGRGSATPAFFCPPPALKNAQDALFRSRRCRRCAAGVLLALPGGTAVAAGDAVKHRAASLALPKFGALAAGLDVRFARPNIRRCAVVA
jgi:hypothetical protein